jgi:hypothetical protein
LATQDSFTETQHKRSEEHGHAGGPITWISGHV